ncbi:M61 family metallopeptidase [Alkalimonas amylolytica]|uniref:Predicted metalloprotease, contains C-terminal PDZ domain n=1 Tax=Alkalimonas amylolytica TaxID=152573 RepID=A0A1H3Z7E8_ALKAM|nr:PDZ domain-containing protein [Alkalimonas amylolytica]SEA19301.1 Predicted metalloprotease, contains C-terminal PDZ domain [Alkalimonas amylolytica]
MKALIQYQLRCVDIAAHLIEMELTIQPQGTEPLRLQLPAWIPGSYMIRDFARNLIWLTASDKDGALEVLKTDKQSWQVHHRGQAVRVHYQLYAYDRSVRAAYLDDEVAILNPACLCLAVAGMEELPHQLQVDAPTDPTTSDWRLATALPPAADTTFLGFGTYVASDYQHLIDSPLLAGHFQLTEFHIDAVPHYLVVSGRNLSDQQRFTADLTTICQQQKAIFGSLPADLTNYWFLTWVTDSGFGGLEHNDSTLLLCSRFDLPAAGQQQINEGYQTLLSLCSHEYLHTWWVKRLKPAEFHPYQLAQEHYSRQLWIYEGFTSYLDDLALYSSGLQSAADYLLALEKTISRVTRNPSDGVQSLEDSSFDAWTKFYKQDENAVNAIASYYAKGALVALALDAALTAHGRSLPQLMQQLWQDYLTSGTPNGAIASVLKSWQLPELASQLTNWVQQPKPIPLADHLPALGLALNWRAPLKPDDLSGPAASNGNAWLGAQYLSTEQGIKLTAVYDQGPAHQAGLMVGDELLAVEGFRLNSNSVTELLLRLPKQKALSLHLFRRDRLLERTLELTAPPATVAQLTIVDESAWSAWWASQARTER